MSASRRSSSACCGLPVRAAAIRVLLDYVRTHSFDIFVIYRFVLAGAVLLLIATGIRPASGHHGGHEAAPPAGHPRPRRTAPHPHPGGRLATSLRERGFRTTQATVSRDVAELGLVKVSREGTAAYALPPRLIEAETSGEDRLRKLLSDLPLEIHEAGLLLVLRTLPGSAHAIAAALDRARWPEVAGSIAGDDTLFVALPDRGSLQRIKRRLLRLSEGGPSQP